MENISWTGRVRNEEELHGVKEERNFPQSRQRRIVNWFGHLCRRNCLLKTCHCKKDTETVISGGKTRKKR